MSSPISIFERRKDSMRTGKCSYCKKSLIGNIGTKTNGVNYCYDHKTEAETASLLW